MKTEITLAAERATNLLTTSGYNQIEQLHSELEMIKTLRGSVVTL